MKTFGCEVTAQNRTRWDRVWMAVLMVGTLFPTTPAKAASQERSGDVLSGSSQSADKLAKADQVAMANVAKTQLAQTGLGFQLPTQRSLSPGEQAAADLQAQIRAFRIQPPKGNALSVGQTQIHFANGDIRQIEERTFEGGITVSRAQDIDSKGKAIAVTESISRSLTTQDPPSVVTYTGVDGSKVYTERMAYADGKLSVYTETTSPDGKVNSKTSSDVRGNATVTESVKRSADGTETRSITTTFPDGLYSSASQITSPDGKTTTCASTVGRESGAFVKPYTSDSVQTFSDGRQVRSHTTVLADGTMITDATVQERGGNQTRIQTVSRLTLEPFQQTASRTTFSDGGMQTSTTRSVPGTFVTDTETHYASGLTFRSHTEAHGDKSVTTTDYSDGRHSVTEKDAVITRITTRYQDGRVEITLQRNDGQPMMPDWTAPFSKELASILGGAQGNLKDVVIDIQGNRVHVAGGLVVAGGQTLRFDAVTFSDAAGPGKVSLQTQIQYSDGRRVTAMTQGDRTQSVTLFPGGERQETLIAQNPNTGKMITMNNRLVDATGKELARSTSAFLEMQDGSLRVTTTVTEGTTITRTEAVKRPDGSVFITGNESNAVTGDMTDFRTTIDPRGNVRREFQARGRGNSFTTGVQENNVTRTVTVVPPATRTESVSTLLPDGTVRTASVSRSTDADGFVRVVTTNEESQMIGVTAVMSPLEPARRVVKKISSQSTSTAAIEPPSWSKTHLQGIADLVTGGTQNTAIGGDGHRLVGSVLIPDGRTLTYTALFQATAAGTTGLNQLNFQLTFSDGRTAVGTSLNGTTQLQIQFPNGSKQMLAVQSAKGSGEIQASHTELFNNNGEIIMVGQSTYSNGSDGSVSIVSMVTDVRQNLQTITQSVSLNGMMRTQGRTVKANTGEVMESFTSFRDGSTPGRTRIVTQSVAKDGHVTNTVTDALNGEIRGTSVTGNSNATFVSKMTSANELRTEGTTTVLGVPNSTTTRFVTVTTGFFATLNPAQGAVFIPVTASSTSQTIGASRSPFNTIRSAMARAIVSVSSAIVGVY